MKSLLTFLFLIGSLGAQSAPEWQYQTDPPMKAPKPALSKPPAKKSDFPKCGTKGAGNSTCWYPLAEPSAKKAKYKIVMVEDENGVRLDVDVPAIKETRKCLDGKGAPIRCNGPCPNNPICSLEKVPPFWTCADKERILEHSESGKYYCRKPQL